MPAKENTPEKGATRSQESSEKHPGWYLDGMTEEEWQAAGRPEALDRPVAVVEKEEPGA